MVYHKWDQGCKWKLRARKLENYMWLIGKYIGERTCNMNTFNENYFNLDTNLIVCVDSTHEIVYTVQDEGVYNIGRIDLWQYHYKGKVFFGCKRAFEIVFSD